MSTDHNQKSSKGKGINLQANRDVNVDVSGDMIAGDKQETHVHVDSGAAAIGDHNMVGGANSQLIKDSQIDTIIHGVGHTINITINKLAGKENALDFDPVVSNDIEKFLVEYLGTPEHPAPFGGRDLELEQLNQWLDSEDAYNMGLMVAGAGGGKSALLVQWSQLITQRDDLTVIFFPISIRFNTALQSTFFKYINKRLAKFYGKKINIESITAPELQRVQFQEFLKETPPHNKRLLLVVDGLDEAVWEVNHLLFPHQLGKNVQLFVSARYQSGDLNEQGWLERMGWQRNKSATAINLRPLTEEGLTSVLESMGNPLDQVATDVDVLAELFRLTEGDPLLVRLYVEALRQQANHKTELRPEDLLDLDPGLNGYLKRWWADQEAQWKAQELDPPTERAETELFLNILSGAIGPLKHHDLALLAPQTLHSSRKVRKLTEDLKRFIVGDGQTQGYVFSHPRLNDYFWDELNQLEQQKITSKFLSYAEGVLAQLNNSQIKTTEIEQYTYVIQHYGAHLVRAEETGIPIARPLYELVSHGWLKAWEALDGTVTGFLQDVDRAWVLANKQVDIAMQVKCALCHSSVATLTSNLPATLLAALYQHEQMTATQVLAIAEKEVHDGKIQDFISSLAPLLPAEYHTRLIALARTPAAFDTYYATLRRDLPFRSVSEQEALVQQALENAHHIRDDDSRFYALVSLAPYLPEPQQTMALQQILDSAQNIEVDHHRFYILNDLIPRLPEPHQTQVLQHTLAYLDNLQDGYLRAEDLESLAPHLSPELLPQALACANNIEDETFRSYALRHLAPYLPLALLSQALTYTGNIEDDYFRALTLGGLVPYLSEPQQMAVLQQALDMAHNLQDDYNRFNVLQSLAPYLPEPQQTAAWQQLLESAHNIEDDASRSRELRNLVPRLPITLFSQALESVNNIQGDYSRHETLKELALHVPVALLPQALAYANTIESDSKRVEMLNTLARYLPEPQQTAVLQQALDSANKIESDSDRSRALASLAHYLPEPQQTATFQQALNSAQSVEYNPFRASALEGFIPHLPVKLHSQILVYVNSIESDADRAKLLGSLVPYLPVELLPQTLAYANNIESNTERSKVLRSLAPYLPVELLPQALEYTINIQSVSDRSDALGYLAPYLPVELLSQALESARNIQDDIPRAHALGSLARQLSEPPQTAVFQQALACANDIQSDTDRSAALRSLASRLPTELHPLMLEYASKSQNIPSFIKTICILSRHIAPTLGLKILNNSNYGQDDSMLPSDTKTVRLIKFLLAGVMNLIILGEFKNARSGQDNPSNTIAMFQRYGILPYLSVKLFPLILEDAINSEENASLYGSHRHTVLKNLVPRLPEELHPQALECAFGIQNDYYRASALAMLVPRLSEPQQTAISQQALDMAYNIEDHSKRSELFGSLAPYLPEPQQTAVLQQALDIAQNIQDAKVLISLAPHLPAGLLSQALGGVIHIQDDASRAKVLAAIAPAYIAHQLPPSPLIHALHTVIGPTQWAQIRESNNFIEWLLANDNAYGNWQALLKQLRLYKRNDFLTVFGYLCALGLAFTDDDQKGAEGLSIAETINEVCAWWP